MICCSHRSTGRWMLNLVTGVGLLLLPCMASADVPDKQIQKGFTLPYGNKPTALGFQGPGFIKTIDVKEGQHVKAGQVLMTQDSSKEEMELKGLQLDASDITVQAAKAEYLSQQANFRIIEHAYKVEGAGNEAEFAKATADREEARLEVIKEEQDQKIKQVKADKQAQVVKDMSLLSPVDGYVQSVDAHIGENVDPSKPVLTIVQNDPLIVEILLPTALAQKLEIGRSLNVSYDEKQWTPAKVTYKAPMANAAGRSQTVHLELPNPQGLDSGQWVSVELPADLTAAPVAEDSNSQSPTVTAGAK